MLALVALVMAAVLGVVGALNNWYAFALGEISTSPQPAVARTAAAPPTDASSASPSAAPGTGSYMQGRKDGVTDGFQAGRAEGRKDGIAHGKERGVAAGKKDGYRAGYSRGYAAGYAVGFDNGHACVKPKSFCKSIGAG